MAARLLAVGAATLVAIALGIAAGVSWAQGPTPDVDARALALADTTGTVPVLVRMRDRPGRSELMRRADEPDDAHAVVRALRETAALSQSGVLAEARARGRSARSYWIANAVALEADADLLRWLTRQTDVAAVEYDQPLVAVLPTSDGVAGAVGGVEWNVTRVGAPALWAAGYTGQGVTYAIADTGVEWQHPALKPHYRGWDGATATHAYNWWDAVHSQIGASANRCGYSAAAPCDDYGHGTHALGIGVGDDGAGNQVGVAPGAKWIACRNMDNGVGRPSTYIECLQFFAAPWDATGHNPDVGRRAHVISNSYGCPASEGCTSESLRLAVEGVRALGIAVVVSAGNYGLQCGTVQDPPAIYASAFSVGATDSSDAMASFSSRGPVTVDGSGRIKPDVVAPGVGIRSSWLGDAYTLLSGTSMAAPHVAGAVALLWSSHPVLTRDVDNTENALRRGAVHVGLTQVCGGETLGSWPNNVAGYGRLDVQAASDLVDWILSMRRMRLPLVAR